MQCDAQMADRTDRPARSSIPSRETMFSFAQSWEEKKREDIGRGTKVMELMWGGGVGFLWRWIV